MLSPAFRATRAVSPAMTALQRHLRPLGAPGFDPLLCRLGGNAPVRAISPYPHLLWSSIPDGCPHFAEKSLRASELARAWMEFPQAQAWQVAPLGVLTSSGIRPEPRPRGAQALPAEVMLLCVVCPCPHLSHGPLWLSFSYFLVPTGWQAEQAREALPPLQQVAQLGQASHCTWQPTGPC